MDKVLAGFVLLSHVLPLVNTMLLVWLITIAYGNRMTTIERTPQNGTSRKQE